MPDHSPEIDKCECHIIHEEAVAGVRRRMPEEEIF